MATIRIGTRGSKLALWQAEWVAAQLRQTGQEVQLEIVSTKGDVSTASLSQVGGQGLFTKEIQRALLDGSVDVAVHSLKDLPTIKVDELMIAAVPERETTADCLISREGATFEELPPGAAIGTGSSRRGAQLLHWRNDVTIADIRGNVDSRLRKLEEGAYDAIVLAEAGLTRLKLRERITERLPQERMLPAIGQGALGLECRADNDAAVNALNALNHPATQAAVVAERSFLAGLLAGCLAPVAAIGTVDSKGKLSLRGRVLSKDGKQVIEGHAEGASNSASDIGMRLASQLADQGAAALIADIKD